MHIFYSLFLHSSFLFVLMICILKTFFFFCKCWAASLLFVCYFKRIQKAYRCEKHVIMTPPRVESVEEMIYFFSFLALNAFAAFADERTFIIIKHFLLPGECAWVVLGEYPFFAQPPSRPLSHLTRVQKARKY